MDRPHVLILGAGFAGLGAAEKLRKAPVNVILIDKHNYHTFQPLLYQVATNLLEADIVGSPIKDHIHKQDNLTFRQIAVTQIDLNSRQVTFEDGSTLSYDYLILALGAKVNFFGVHGASDHAFPLYTLTDATRLRNQILTRFEMVEKDPSLIEHGALNFVIVGGGPTGVEISGALAIYVYHDLYKIFPTAVRETTRIVLVDGSQALLQMFKEKSQVYAKNKLEELGVEVLLGQHIVEVGSNDVIFQSGDKIKSQTLIWAGGLQANPLVKNLGIKLSHGNRLAVGPDLALSDHPEVFVTGDIAMITDGKSGETLPQLGSVAIQSGQHAGDSIVRQLEGKSVKPFSYLDKGTMATIAAGAAVLQTPRGRTLTGKVAFLSWGVVHLALLGGGGRRASALEDYGFALFSDRRSAKIEHDEDVE